MMNTVMYRTVESLYCTPETNITLQINYSLIINFIKNIMKNNKEFISKRYKPNKNRLKTPVSI